MRSPLHCLLMYSPCYFHGRPEILDPRWIRYFTITSRLFAYKAQTTSWPRPDYNVRRSSSSSSSSSSSGKFITITWGLCVGRCAAFWCIAHVTSVACPVCQARGYVVVSQLFHSYFTVIHVRVRGVPRLLAPRPTYVWSVAGGSPVALLRWCRWPRLRARVRGSRTRRHPAPALL